MKKDTKVVIVGAGVAGLVAALELEKEGISPVILEATDRVGGRVKTDYEDGFQYDHGFQVLLTAYPEVNRYLEVKKLDLKTFKPGALIYSKGRSFLLADPLREPSTLLKAITSPAGNLIDKWKIWRLSEELKNTSIDSIFSSPSSSTLDYLKEYGFSDKIIHHFFRPFFSGIFLEKGLATSSRMFRFIFKMFSEGHAAVPEKGMQAIPNQLLSQLNSTTLHYHSKVTAIADGKISTDTETYDYDAVILATDPNSVLPNSGKTQTKYQSTVNLYFSVPKSTLNGYIGLKATTDSLINNISFMTDVVSSYAPADKALISVSVVGVPELTGKDLSSKVHTELSDLLELEGKNIQFLKSYRINQALPELEMPTMEVTKKSIVQDKNVFLAGDHLVGGSLNGAMATGRYAAQEVMTSL